MDKILYFCKLKHLFPPNCWPGPQTYKYC